MSSRAIDLAQNEYDYLQSRKGAGFFLALSQYSTALHDNRRIRKIFGELQKDVDEASQRTKNEQIALIEEAKAIRVDLAHRAPEVDNSDMERPANPLSQTWTEYDRDSFARFDELAAAPVEIRYSPLPSASEPDATMSLLLGILRGRLTAAEYGENPNGPRIRDDLGDLGQRIGNLARRYEHSVRGYKQDDQALPGLALARLVTFGSDLNPEPAMIESDADLGRLLDELIREWGDPRTVVRKLVNGEQLDERTRRSVDATERALKGEAEKLHQELFRRLARVPFWRSPVKLGAGVSAVATAVVAGLILCYAFGIG